MRGHGVSGFVMIGIVAAAIAAGAAALMPAVAPSMNTADPRELRLAVRDMTFYVEGEDQPNPVLRFRAGEEVRLVLKNEDAGMDHDFTIRGWNVGTTLLEGKGEAVVRFRVPQFRGSESYTCTPHSQMMRGTIEVE